MKNERLYLSNILECIEKIQAYVSSGKNAFWKTPMIQDAVIRNFEIIGEATKRLSLEFRATYPEISWRQMAGFRDILIHDYLRVDLNEVWKTIEQDLPKLKEKIEEIVQELDS